MHPLITKECKPSIMRIIALFLIAAFVGFIPSRATEYYVTTSPPHCKTLQPCHTIEDYAANLSFLFPGKTNVSLMFMEGVHILSNINLVIKNVTTLTLSGTSIETPTTVQMMNSKVIFSGIQELRVEYISFGTYSQASLAHIDHSAVQHVSYSNTTFWRCVITLRVASGQKIVSTDNSLIQYNHTLSPMPAVHTLSLDGSTLNCSILQVTVKEHSAIDISIAQSHFLSSMKTGVMISVGDMSMLSLAITNSTITGNRHHGLFIKTGKKSKVKTRITHCQIMNNVVGILFVVASESRLEVDLKLSILKSNRDGMFISKCQTGTVNVTNSSLSDNSHYGLLATSSNLCKRRYNTSHPWQIKIENTTVENNFGGGISLKFYSRANSYVSSIRVTIKSCLISHNKVIDMRYRSKGSDLTRYASGVSIWATELVGKPPRSILFKNVSLIENLSYSKQTIISLFNLENVIFKDCLFQRNRGTSVKAYNTNFILSGETSFENNVAIQGGAFSLIFSTVYFTEDSVITFRDNTARSVGGAIYVKNYQKTLSPYNKCFYRLVSTNTAASESTALYFINNTAAYGGEDIYCTSVNDWCDVLPEPGKSGSSISSIFHFDENKTSLSIITSDPKRVCLCDDHMLPQCTNVSYVFTTEERYPGEIFHISTVLVGIEFGTVTGSVYAQLLHRGTNHLGRGQHSQAADYRKCNDLEYSIHSSRNHEVLVLTANEEFVEQVDDRLRLVLNPTQLEDIPIFINVTLNDCPLGFTLQGDPPVCQCHETLRQHGIKNCTIVNRNGLIYRSGRVWLNASFNGNHSDGVAVHKHCPYDYCKEQIVPTDLRYPDVQCALNHSGILCGGCLPNLSLALGSNQCRLCSNNNHLALLLFFAAAGFLLVMSITMLDLTVAQGEINGLIFYANIAWTYRSILFPAHRDYCKEQMLQFLQTFLAWLNLDFGIETCFIVGLNAYWKTWLQFVFPIYIWSIAGLMILASHLSRRVTKYLGTNVVQVLATLFLISYVKLLRLLSTIIGFAKLNYPNERSIMIWLYDGNVPFLGSQHVFLFIAALLALFLLWLPYVSTLLLVPCLKRKSHLKPLRWINRWKPFYDAYYGPFKDKHHYWVGLLLFVRGFLVFIFPAVFSNDLLLVYIVTPAAILFYIWFVGKVYKKWYLSALEGLSHFNLVILGSSLLCSDDVRTVIVQVSVWSAFLQLVCIIVYHVWCSIKKHCSVEKCKSVKMRPACAVDNGRMNIVETYDIDRDELRECLIEESQDKV